MKSVGDLSQNVFEDSTKIANGGEPTFIGYFADVVFLFIYKFHGMFHAHIAYEINNRYTQ